MVLCHTFYFVIFSIQTYGLITYVAIIEAYFDVFTADVQKRVAGTGIKSGPAVQQADTLLSELRRTIAKFFR
jgi:hypothetical protein